MAATGVGSVSVIAVASVLTGAWYVGPDDEPYSPLNHWISELGQVAESKLAPIFNLGLIVGGAMLGFFFLGLIRHRGVLGWIGGMLGVGAGVAGALAGLFPMDNPSIHFTVAGAFFVLVPTAICLQTLALWRLGRVNRLSAFAAAFTAILSASYVAVTAADLAREMDSSPSSARPDVIVDPVLEWLALVGAMVWVVSVARELFVAEWA